MPKSAGADLGGEPEVHSAGKRYDPVSWGGQAMDTFFILVGLFLLAFPIIAIVALVKSVTLADQLRRIDIRLSTLERRLAQSPPAPTAATATVPPEPEPQPIVREPAVE